MTRIITVLALLTLIAACGNDGRGSQYSSARAGQDPQTYIPVTPGATPVTDTPVVVQETQPTAAPAPDANPEPVLASASGPSQVLRPRARPAPGAARVKPAITPAPSAPRERRYANGVINDACLAADRKAANAALCGCIQWVAKRNLSQAQQRRGAGYFENQQKLQDVRQSDRAGDEQFWKAWKAFGEAAKRQCSGL